MVQSSGMKKQPRVIVGVTSGIAAFKTVELVRRLKRAGMAVRVIVSPYTFKMVAGEDLAKASGHKVYGKLFEANFDYKKVLKTRVVDHIKLADEADLIVVVPATANTMAKLAYGLADNFLTTTVLAATCPVLVCPSMNVNMWQHPAVKNNVKRLKDLGYLILGPAEGRLACGWQGKGRLENIVAVVKEVDRLLNASQRLKGKKVLVTYGATREPIDRVRAITNPSSGKMGAAVAETLYRRGAEVSVFRAENAVEPRYRMKQATFVEARDLDRLISREITKFDICFQVAAVGDFMPKTTYPGKLDSAKPLKLTLTPGQKIVTKIKRLAPKIKLIAFKAEYGLNPREMAAVGKVKLKQTRAYAVAVNDVSRPDRGFGTETNELVVVLKSGKIKKIPLAGKNEVAEKLVDMVL
ncbi:MAG: Coenzyme A biosynthesis bifunctional protein CoaBC [Candidatus Beckwithbacteria bacterium GW2011_GWB1_47_15]|uniref:Coenzyme A biosynthesis bifunctional protein CoaBC n=1 Tax=Candidatus Beckwithbacteria bacterium GW2011_GWB1_47_15 TaxID=1618371 RepID=A0A0G1RTQ0_9BACT|nr:MAG: Coenzyme A biosynthesis bifunctional protein CoaBC [Candidatus Beckwithbacteria bacterium GW2011_GWB1_47_15]